MTSIKAFRMYSRGPEGLSHIQAWLPEAPRLPGVLPAHLGSAKVLLVSTHMALEVCASSACQIKKEVWLIPSIFIYLDLSIEPR